MRLSKKVDNVPFYLCEAPPHEYEEVWDSNLVKEIEDLYEREFPGALLRGIREVDLETVAKSGIDRCPGFIGMMTYVGISVDYAFSKAKSGIIIYDSSKLREFVGDPMGPEGDMNDMNRYEFLTHPKEAIMGIVDLREVNQTRKTRTFKKLILKNI